MIKLTTAALIFLAAGLMTSVSILGGFQVLFALSAAYFTFITVKNKQFKLPTSAYFLMGFAIIAALSLIINADVVPRFSKNFSGIKYLLFGILGIFVFNHWLPLASEKAKKIVCGTFFLSLIVAGSYALYQCFIQGQERTTGLTETMRYGYGSGMILLSLISAILNRKKISSWFDVRFAIVAFIFGFVGMYLTYTRGALLGFLCGLPIVLYFYKPKLGLTLGSLAMGIVFTLGGFYLFGSGNYNSRFLVNSQNGSDMIRRSQWESALIATSERPILGYGFENFTSQIKRIKEENNLYAKDYLMHSHNQFLEVSSGTGIVGLFFFLGWLVFWAYESLKSTHLVRALVVPFGVAFFVSSQFEVTLNANISSMIFIVYAISSSISLKKNH